MSQVEINVENPEVLQNNPQVQQALQQVAPAVNTALQNDAPIDATVAQEQPQGGVDFAALQQLQQQQQGQQQGVDFNALQQLQPPQQTNEDPLGVVGKGLDMLDDFTRKGAGAGILDAVINAGEFVTSTGKFIHDIWDKGWDKAKYREENWDTVRKAVMPESEPTSMAGDIAKGIAQWATGFIATGGAGSAMQIGAAATKFGRYAQVLGKGAVTDSLFFDRQQDRIADFVNQHFPELANPVTQYLGAKGKDENMAESMLKMAVEGAGLSLALDGLVKGLKCLKRGKDYFSNPTDKNAKAYTESAEELDNSISKGVDNEGANATRTESGAGNTPPTSGQATSDAGEAGAKSTDNTAAKNTKQPQSNLTYEQLKPAEEVIKDIDKIFKDGNTPFKNPDTINMAHEIFNNPEGAKYMDYIADVQADNALKHAKGPESHRAIINDCLEDFESMGVSWNGMMSDINSATDALPQISRTMYKARALLHTMCDAVSPIYNKLANGLGSISDKAQLIAIIKNTQELAKGIADMRTGAGRLLSSMKMNIDSDLSKQIAEGGYFKNWFTPENITEEGFAKFMKDTGFTDESLMNIAKGLQATEGDVGAIMKLLQKAQPTWSWKDVVQELRVNNLLSSPITSLVNFGSSAANVAVVHPLRRFIGGSLSAIGGDTAGLRSAWNYMKGMNSGFFDSLRMARQAWKMGDNVLDSSVGASRLEQHQNHAITYEKFREWMLRDAPAGTELSSSQEAWARRVAWLGEKFRLPTRFLMAQDEFCKQIAFRGQYMADMSELAYRQGIKDPKELDSFLKSKMKEAFNPDGSVIKNDYTANALDWAQKGTWTNPLDKGTTAAQVQGVLNRSFVFKLVVPFYKTPMNLFYDTCRHLNYVGNIRTAIQQGGEARADALGRIAVGSGILASSFMLAAEGRITGSYPKDKKEAALWKSQGIQPYSIKIGNKWVEYRRFDPFATLLSIPADVYTKVAYDNADGNDDVYIDPTVDKAIAGLLVSVTNNLMDKTYLQGVSDAIKSIEDVERYGPRYIGGMVSSMVPYSSALRYANRRMLDPEEHELKTKSMLMSTWNYIKSGLPGASSTLPVKHDWIDGKPALYRGAIVREQDDDPVKAEMLRLGSSVLGGPTKKLYGVDLTPEQYSRLCELHGSIKYNGKTMYETLDAIIHSPGYDLERKNVGDSLDGQESPRSQIVNRVIHKFREAAQHQMLVEFPDILEKAKTAKMEARASKAGALAAPTGSKGKYDNLIRFGNM